MSTPSHSYNGSFTIAVYTPFTPLSCNNNNSYLTMLHTKKKKRIKGDFSLSVVHKALFVLDCLKIGQLVIGEECHTLQHFLFWSVTSVPISGKSVVTPGRPGMSIYCRVPGGRGLQRTARPLSRDETRSVNPLEMKTVRTPDLFTKAGWAWHATICILAPNTSHFR